MCLRWSERNEKDDGGGVIEIEIESQDEADSTVPKGERAKSVKVARHGNRERASVPIRGRAARLSGFLIGPTSLTKHTTGQLQCIITMAAPLPAVSCCPSREPPDSDLFVSFSMTWLAVAKQTWMPLGTNIMARCSSPLFPRHFRCAREYTATLCR